MPSISESFHLGVAFVPSSSHANRLYVRNSLTATLAIEHTQDSRHYVLVLFFLEEAIVATNPPKGDGHRNGAVKDRSQTYNPKTENWVKRDADTGKFLDVKQDGTPFKGVRKEK